MVLSGSIGLVSLVLVVLHSNKYISGAFMWFWLSVYWWVCVVVCVVEFLGGFFGGFFGGLSYNIGYDSLSIFFIVLALLVTLVSFLSIAPSGGVLNAIGGRGLATSFILLGTLLVWFFIISSGIEFFICFELCVIPIFFLISYWGSQRERVFSNYYFLFYSLMAPVPFLFLIISSVSRGIGTYFYTTHSGGWVASLGGEALGPWVVFSLVLGFLTNLPIYGFHIWLPKAHVDAPVSSSMVLASVILKMSSYGLMRLSVFEWVVASPVIMFIVGLGMWGFFVTSVLCLRLVDFKVIVAFSSVSHMSIAIVSVLSAVGWSVLGSFLVFLGHSFISPLLFYLGTLVYSRTGSRLVVGAGGTSILGGSFYVLLLLGFMINFGFPPFLNFFGEVGIFYSVFTMGELYLVVVFLGFLFSSVYMMGLVVGMIHHGASYKFLSLRSLSMADWLLGVFMLACYVLLGLVTHIVCVS